MITHLTKLVGKLQSYLPELESKRSDVFANDVYEAATYWCYLGRHGLEHDTRINYPARAKTELELLGRLQEILRKQPSKVRVEHAPILQAGERILRFVETIHPPAGGHLDVVRVIHERFRFLQTNYSFEAIDDLPLGVRYTSREVYLKLQYSQNPSISCSFGLEMNSEDTFWIDDLLFMYGDLRYKSLPQMLLLDTRAAVEHWFAFLADVFEKYGSALFGNEPGFFDRLAQAQTERDIEFRNQLQREHGKSE